MIRQIKEKNKTVWVMKERWWNAIWETEQFELEPLFSMP